MRQSFSRANLSHANPGSHLGYTIEDSSVILVLLGGGSACLAQRWITLTFSGISDIFQAIYRDVALKSVFDNHVNDRSLPYWRKRWSVNCSKSEQKGRLVLVLIVNILPRRRANETFYAKPFQDMRFHLVEAGFLKEFGVLLAQACDKGLHHLTVSNMWTQYMSSILLYLGRVLA